MLLPVLNNTSGSNDHDAAARDAIARDLSRLVQGEVRFGLHDRMLYATDASLYQVEPIGVVVPRSVEEIRAVIGYCGRHGVAVLPRGGGTSLAGQCTNRAVVIDASAYCRGIGEIEGDATVWVEPGVAVDELNRELSRRTRASGRELFFAPDPATTAQATIGGCVGNNAAGSRSIRYGRTSENLVALDACLSTGERVTLSRGAGATSEVARRLGDAAIALVRENAALIRERFPRTIRRNAGYGLDLVLNQLDAEPSLTGEGVDLSGLLCGSEGTLAATLRAKLELVEAPRSRALAVLTFRTLEDAIAAVQPILETGRPLGLSAVELLDDVVLEAAMGSIEYRRYVEMLPGGETAASGGLKAVLYVEFFGFGASAQQGGEQVMAGLGAMSRLAASLPGFRAIGTFTDAGAMLAAWKLRKAGEPLLHGLPGKRKPVTFVEDNAVPVERLGEFVREFKKIVARHGTRAAYWAHASVGVLHVRPMIDLHDEEDRARLRDIAVEVADLARACGGIMSGEHGDGRVRGPLLERFFGPELMRAFARLKKIFDPAGVLNPGNIVGAGPVASITANLRTLAGGESALGSSDDGHEAESDPGSRQPLAPGRDARSTASPPTGGETGHSERNTGGHGVVETYFDYSDQHGFRGAIEMCNGAGLCRKRTGGTMCPSYMALLDERHATRGRGNALRLAVSGQFADGTRPSWDDPETMKTLDLCLSCKACKSECPSNVDIARLKAEYTAQRYRQKGRAPLAAILTGHVRVLNRLGSMMPGMANWVNSLAPVGGVIKRVMGMSKKRTLPRFERSLYAWMGKRGIEGSWDQGIKGEKKRVVLFGDCFTAYNEPHIGEAAVRVLERLGCEVALLPKEGAGGTFGGGCCGRSMISVGMLPAAIETADATLEALREAVDDPGVEAIVVCEPSCLSAFRDDWLQLKMRAPLELRKKLAKKAMMVEEFAARLLAENRGHVEAAATGKIVVHGHCHQKALWGLDGTKAALHGVAPGRVRVLDTGCCGMAGAFGYAAHRHDLSMRIGELALMPAAREAEKAGETIAASGTSCRHQIHDATGAEALHPIEVIARALGV